MTNDHYMNMLLHFDPYLIYVAEKENLENDDDYYNRNEIYSPEYYFVWAMTCMYNTLSMKGVKELQYFFPYITFAADGLMKNLVFRDEDIPAYAWVLLEPKGVLSNHYEKRLFAKFAEQPFLVQDLVACYNKCKLSSDSHDFDVLFEQFCESYNALQQMYDIYLQLASDKAKHSLELVAYAYSTKGESERDSEPIVCDTNVSHYVVTQYTGPNDLGKPWLQGFSKMFLKNISKSDFAVTLDYPIAYSIYKGVLLPCGKNADVDCWLLNALQKYYDVTILMNDYRAMDYKVVFTEYLNVLELLLKGGNSEVKKYSHLQDKTIRDILVDGTLVDDIVYAYQIPRIVNVIDNIDSVTEEELVHGIQNLINILCWVVIDISEYESDDKSRAEAFKALNITDVKHINYAFGDLNDDIEIDFDVIDALNNVVLTVPDYPTFPDKEAFDWFYTL